jgi:hypothetical protein
VNGENGASTYMLDLSNLAVIAADGPIRASVILVSRSGANARGWFESISWPKRLAIVAASYFGRAQVLRNNVIICRQELGNSWRLRCSRYKRVLNNLGSAVTSSVLMARSRKLVIARILLAENQHQIVGGHAREPSGNEKPRPGEEKAGALRDGRTGSRVGGNAFRPNAASLGGCDADILELVRRNALKHRPAIGVKLAIACVPVAQIARILVVVGRHIHGLRRSNARRRQHHGCGDDSGDLAGHIVLHCLPALWSGRMGPNLHPSTVKMCGIDAFGIAEIAKGLLGWAK